ncbi:MAG: helicase DnaB [Cyanobium sp. CACIAM 14]|nr:MAG: helicase DnaB [Cyanobium sp. CACIAM 14]
MAAWHPSEAPGPLASLTARLHDGLRLTLLLAAAGITAVPLIREPRPLGRTSLLLTGGFTATAGAATIPRPFTSEGQRPDPVDFSSEELSELNRRFGVHGPQPRLAQLFTEGIDQLQPLRSHTLARLEELRPVILSESRRHRVNPMLVTAVLFDELQHAKPGEDLPIAARSGLFSTHGPAQLSIGELVKQGLLPADATPEQIEEARMELLDPDHNIRFLVGKFVRLKQALGLSGRSLLMASTSPADAKALATLAYLHNGKLDYPGRVLRYMQDPELHALLYGRREPITSPLI